MNAIVGGTFKVLRRHTGAVGCVTPLGSGVIFQNDVDGMTYVGVGDDGSGNSTSQVAIGTALFASAALGALLSKLPTTLPSTSGQAWLNGGVLSVS